jgi:hypothetical protein
MAVILAVIMETSLVGTKSCCKAPGMASEYLPWLFVVPRSFAKSSRDFWIEPQNYAEALDGAGMNSICPFLKFQLDELTDILHPLKCMDCRLQHAAR